VPFSAVLDRRSSQRDFGELSRANLGSLLWHAARVRSTDRGQHRSAPSAGGLHPIEFVVLEPPFQHAFLYDPVRHALGELADIDSQLLADACGAMVAVLPLARGTFIVALADFERTGALYEEPDSLVWRDAGCALATLHLTAAWLSLGSCLLGIVGAAVAEVVGRDGRVRPVGAIAVGQL
jgi:SagB-type dehydrogenase family enzyme